MKFKPMNSYVVLDWYKDEDSVSSGGIILENVKGKRGDFAKVLAISSDSDLEVGQTVVFNKLGGKFAIIEEKEVLIIPENEIFAVIE